MTPPDRKRWTKEEERHRERVEWLKAHPQRLEFARAAAKNYRSSSLRLYPYDSAARKAWQTMYAMMLDAGIYRTKHLTDDIFPGFSRAVREAVSIPTNNAQ